MRSSPINEVDLFLLPADQDMMGPNISQNYACCMDLFQAFCDLKGQLQPISQPKVLGVKQLSQALPIYIGK